jgi:hypothetical protein
LKREAYYTWLFFTGAIWNIIIAIIYLVLPALGFDLFSFFGTPEPSSRIWYDLFFGAVLIFGIGYYMVGRDITKNEDIVKLAIVGKFGVFLIALYYFILGEVNIVMLLPASVDLIYGFLFLEFLVRY